jgi:hypothetical protein
LSGFRFTDYAAPSGREMALLAGATGTANGDAPLLLIIPPLFEELHKLRQLIRAMMAALAQRGISSILPDLPGSNESLTSLSAVDWAQWEAAVSQIRADFPSLTHIAALRGGCLIGESASPALPRWHFEPVDGAKLIHRMERAQQASDREAGPRAKSAETSGMLIGYRLSGAMIGALRTALPIAPATRTVRLNAMQDANDIILSGQPLWLRAEPGEDAALAAALAVNVAEWMQP